jgi:carbonic anhydrase/acetyltransferase-like protein (isoleucine patch superfamily)
LRRQCGISFADKQYFSEFKETRIGNDVWIGENSIVMDGVTIGNGAIVAAGSVVVKDVAPFSIVGGVPARLIRLRFVPEKIRFIEDSQWWNRDESWLRENLHLFHDVERFVSLGNSG